MPLGKVFDAREGQVLISPVTGYYQGKAIRAGLAQQQKDLEQADARLDLEDRRTRVSEAEVGLRRDALNQQQADKQAIDGANMSIGIFDQYSELRRQDPERASTWMTDTMTQIHDGLEAGEEKSWLGERLRDGVISHDDAIGFYSESLAMKNQYLDKASGGKPSNLTNMYHPESKHQIAVRPESEMADELAQRGYLSGNPPAAESGKPLAVERKLDLARQVLNKTGEYEGISDEEQAAYLAALDVQTSPKGSVTMNWDTAEDLADSIIEKTEIGENWIGNNDDDFTTTLTFSLMRLAKDGRFGGKDLEHRALLDALGYTWKDAVEALNQKNAEGEEVWTMDDIIQALADE